MYKLLLIIPFLSFSFCSAQNHIVIGTEFGAKVDNYFYVNNLGQTFKQNYSNPSFGFNAAFQHKQHIFETGFYAYLFFNPGMDYDFVNNNPQKSLSSGGSGLSDYWIPIKYGYEFPLTKMKNLLLQPGLAFNIFVGEYYPNQPGGSWGSSTSTVGSTDAHSINTGVEYINGKTNFGLEPQLTFTYRIAKKYDIFCNASYQFGLKPRYYDLITHTNSITNETIEATRTHSNSLLLKIGFKYHFILKKKS